MVSAYLALLAAIALQRLGELWISRRNTRWALARGGIERGQAQLPVMKLLHGSFLLACALEVVWLERRFDPRLAAPMLTLLAGAQLLRLASLRALGRRWNVRVIVVPGMPRVCDGPYRWLAHPNYLAVAAEMAAIPLIHGAWLCALFFSLANALLLRARIRCEERALDTWAQPLPPSIDAVLARVPARARG
jgi:methyltransferase